MSFLSNLLGGAPANKGGNNQAPGQGNRQQQQQEPQNQPQGSSGQGNQNPNNPAGGNFNQDPNANGSNANQNVNGSNTPVDPSQLWSKMWDNTNEGDNNKAPPQLSLDPNVLNEVSGKMDFTQGADPELVQKAMSGDGSALVSLLNHVGRAAYRSSLSHGGALTNEFVGQREAFSGSKLKGHIRDQLTENILSDGELAKAPPFVRKQMQDLSKRIQAANPDATPAEVSSHVREYVKQLSQFVNGGQSSNQGSEGGQGQQSQEQTDWDNWLQ